MPAPEQVLAFEDARHCVEQHAAQLRPHGKELVELLDSAGQVLAEVVPADRNFPPFPAPRAMDTPSAPPISLNFPPRFT